MTKLKDTWVNLPEEDRTGWQDFFSSGATNAAIRLEISTRLNIHLQHDPQFCRFRDWELDLRRRQEEDERVREDCRQLIEEFGAKWTLDQIRAEVIKRSYARALASGDFKHALATVREDVRIQRMLLEERRVVVLEQRVNAVNEAEEEVFRPKLTPEENRRRLREILK